MNISGSRNRQEKIISGLRNLHYDAAYFWGQKLAKRDNPGPWNRHKIKGFGPIIIALVMFWPHKLSKCVYFCPQKTKIWLTEPISTKPVAAKVGLKDLNTYFITIIILLQHIGSQLHPYMQIKLYCMVDEDDTIKGIPCHHMCLWGRENRRTKSETFPIPHCC